MDEDTFGANAMIVCMIAVAVVTGVMASRLVGIVEPLGRLMGWIGSHGPWAPRLSVLFAVAVVFAGLRLLSAPLQIMIMRDADDAVVAFGDLLSGAVARGLRPFILGVFLALLDGMVLFLVASAVRVEGPETQPWLVGAGWNGLIKWLACIIFLTMACGITFLWATLIDNTYVIFSRVDCLEASLLAFFYDFFVYLPVFTGLAAVHWSNACLVTIVLGFCTVKLAATMVFLMAAASLDRY